MAKISSTLLERSRTFVEKADDMSLALAQGDEAGVQDAIDDLLVAYDQYAGHATTAAGRFGFDEVASEKTATERDQSAAGALASALIDFQVANLLIQAAQASGEAGGAAPEAVDESVSTLHETLQAVESASDSVAGPARFGFDEVAAASPASFSPSPDLQTARAAYAQRLKEVYDCLMEESTALMVASFKGVDKLDAAEIKAGLKKLLGPQGSLDGNRFVGRAWDAFKRAVNTLKGLIGQQGMEELESRLDQDVDQIKKGEGALQLFLTSSYQVEQNQKKIAAWLEATQKEPLIVDQGAKKLGDLRQEVVQTFTLCSKIVGSVHSLASPIEWVIKKFGGTAPLDLLLSCLFILVADVALLRGMDYADTTTIVKFVDGTVAISRQALGVKE